jgi:carbon-monoxide dehydrogenase small subunit
VLIRVRVNGEWREADSWAGASLLAFLRDRLHLLGTKNACEQGECGSCSVWLDDEVVCACLVLAAQAEGRDVRTIETLGDETAPGLVQRAFVEAGAVQCGFCTPGLIVAVTDLLERDPDPSDTVLRETLAGNVCRCTGYQKIVDAVHVAARRAAEARA